MLTQSSAPVFGSVVLVAEGFAEAVAIGEEFSRETGVAVGAIVGAGLGELKFGFPALYKLHEFSFCFTRTAQERFWFGA